MIIKDNMVILKQNITYLIGKELAEGNIEPLTAELHLTNAKRSIGGCGEVHEGDGSVESHFPVCCVQLPRKS